LGRTTDLEKISRLVANNHISVVGPKYIGKTVFLRAAADRLAEAENGFTGVIYWDMRHSTPADDSGFYVAFADILSRGLRSTSPDESAWIAELGSEPYEGIEDAFRTLAEEKKRYLVCLDGFDDLLGGGVFTKALWDNLRNLGELGSLKYLTGSRRRLRELCKVRALLASDFWRLFGTSPFKLTCLSSEDIRAFLKPMKDGGRVLEQGAVTEIVNWSGGIPLLVSLICSELWEQSGVGSMISNSTVTSLMDNVIAGADDALDDLWQSFDVDQQVALASICRRDVLRATDVPGLLNPLLDAGMVIPSGTGFAVPSGLLRRYAAGGSAQTGLGVKMLFGDRKSFDRNIRNVLDLRLKQVESADDELRDHLMSMVEKLDKPHVVIGSIRLILNRAFELIWQSEFGGTTVPGDVIREWKRLTDRPVPSTVPADIGPQCQLLKIITDPNCEWKARTSRYTYTLIEGMPAPGNIGSHLTGSRPDLGYCVALGFWCIQLVEQLSAELRAFDAVRQRT
jgi:hypothetical protein